MRAMVRRREKWIRICLWGKVFGLPEGTDEMDEEEHRKVIDGLKLFRYCKQMEELKLQDEGLAIVQDAVAKHLLSTVSPLLDVAMMGLRGSKPHPTASIGKHVKHKCPMIGYKSVK